MRPWIGIAAAFVLALHAAPAAAQLEMQPQVAFAPAATPLPESLVPGAADGAAPAKARISGRRFLVSVGIGALAGAATGMTMVALTSDGCSGDEWCILEPEEEVAIGGIAGAIGGAAVGALYGLLSGSGRPRAEPAPITVAPAADGGLSLGLSLTH